MKIIKYEVDTIEDNIRYINVYLDSFLLVELECLGSFLTDQEEIQNWLDDNGYEDDNFNFEIL